MIGRPRMALEDAAIPEPMSGCLIWIGSTHSDGYGVVHRAGRVTYVHRLAYEQAGGTIPPGAEIDHLCRVRSCINPKHLEAVPPRVNWERTNNPAAINSRKTTCIRGHELTECVWSEGRRRYCRTCLAARAK